jgi:hypothetical protein
MSPYAHARNLCAAENYSFALALPGMSIDASAPDMHGTNGMANAGPVMGRMGSPETVDTCQGTHQFHAPVAAGRWSWGPRPLFRIRRPGGICT